MRALLIYTVTLFTLNVSAMERILSCEDRNGQSPLYISIWTTENVVIESYGQVSLRPYHSVNLICNNAIALKSLHKDILCTGLDRQTTPASPTVLTESILATDSGYTWRGLDCQ